MQTLPLLSVLSLLSALAILPREARAQTTPSVSGIEGAVLRCESPATAGCTNADAPAGNPHPSGVLDNVINFEDCEANLYYQFELGISYPSSSYNLQAWVGSQDCSQLANRQTSTTSTCWPVAPFTASLVNPYLLNVRVRDIAASAFSTQHPVVYTPTGSSDSDDAVCETQTQTGANALVLYLFFADAEANPVGTVQQYPLTLDLRAGEVQGHIAVGVGNDSVVVQVPPTTDPDTQGYNVYCDPPANQAVAAPTTDSGVPSATECAASSVLVPGGGGSLSEEGGSPIDGAGVTGGAMSIGFQYGQPDAKYLCATGSASATSIAVAGLNDGEPYNIAVAAVDGDGNVGPLSNVACSEPAQSGSAGGVASAGGISCSTGGPGAPAGTSGLGVLMLAFMGALARRRRLTH